MWGAAYAAVIGMNDQTRVRERDPLVLGSQHAEFDGVGRSTDTGAQSDRYDRLVDSTLSAAAGGRSRRRHGMRCGRAILLALQGPRRNEVEPRCGHFAVR